MTEFHTAVGGGEYKLTFTTSEKKYYLLIQETAQSCVDGKPVSCVPLADNEALTCEVGDEVRATVQRPYNGHTTTIHGVVSDIQTVVRVSYYGARHVDFLASDFGKTVFLTRQEAEAALGGTK